MFPFERNTAFVLQGSPSGRLPRFARNDKVLRTEYNKSLFTRIYLQNFRAIFILSRATHFMSLRGIANGDAVAISRKGYLVINPRKILLYLRGEKGAHKQKTNNCRLRRLFGQKCSVRRGARQYHRSCGGIVF